MLLTSCNAQGSPHNEELSIQNVNSSEIEKSCDRAFPDFQIKFDLLDIRFHSNLNSCFTAVFTFYGDISICVIIHLITFSPTRLTTL